MFLTKKHLSRLTALKGLGVSLALPLLDAMIPAGTPLAKTAAAQKMRAGRLVVDTGIHSRRWTRRRAVAWFHECTGDPIGSVISEVDRYCVSPGQACGYKVGHSELLRLRARMKAMVGPKFDLRDYNDTVVKTGAVPLTVLARVIDEHAAVLKG